MIVAARVGDPEADDDVAEKRRIRAAATPACAKYAAAVKGQLINAGVDAIAGEERRRCSSVGVGDGRGDQATRATALDDVQLDGTPLAGVPRAVSST